MGRLDAVIVGLGDTGFACARFLRAQGRRVAVTDTRAAPPRAAALAREYPEVTQHLGELEASLLRSAGEVVLSPGVDPRLPAIREAAAAGVPIIGEIDLFRRATDAPMVAITGSNGKSTVTTLVGRMAEAAGVDVAVGGNLGTPMLDLLRDPMPALFVLELSSFQLETATRLDAVAATVLNLSADHMDRYDGMAEYGAAKARIFEGIGCMVLNADDPAVMAMARRGRELRRFRLGSPMGPDDAGLADHDGEPWLHLGTTPVLPAAAVRLPGRTGVANALAALALGQAAGLPVASMAAAIREFSGLPHRMEVVAEHNDVLWINDSKATNVGATASAVAGLDRPLLLIAGGQGKGQDFDALAASLAGRVREVLLIGEDASRLAAALTGHCRLTDCVDLRTAVLRAASQVRPGDAVLLSPACASFDQFRNFADRGDQFRRLVGEVLHG
jgi:UDP-N-acetylmuramoylalanine--D-glutamate ligase